TETRKLIEKQKSWGRIFLASAGPSPGSNGDVKAEVVPKETVATTKWISLDEIVNPEQQLVSTASVVFSPAAAPPGAIAVDASPTALPTLPTPPSSTSFSSTSSPPSSST